MSIPLVVLIWYHMIQMWLLTRKFGFDPPSGSHQLPVFLKYSVRLKLLAQLVHMRERNTFAAGHKLFLREGSKNVWFQLTKTANDNLCKITKFTHTSSVWNFRR